MSSRSLPNHEKQAAVREELHVATPLAPTPAGGPNCLASSEPGTRYVAALRRRRHPALQSAGTRWSAGTQRSGADREGGGGSLWNSVMPFLRLHRAFWRQKQLSRYFNIFFADFFGTTISSDQDQVACARFSANTSYYGTAS